MANKKNQRWVIRCTEESIKAGKVSLFALAEVGLSVALYWCLAFHFDGHWMMFISLFAAPILLLRSNKSNALGVGWLRYYYNKNVEDISRNKKYLIFVIAILTSFAFSYWLALQWLPGYDGLAFFLRAAFINSWLAVAAAAVVVGAVVGTEVLGTVGVGAAVAGAAGILLPSLALGLVLRATIIRFCACLRHPLKGLTQLPRNWRDNLLTIDLTHLPELMPGATKVNEFFSVKGLWEELKTTTELTKTFFCLITIPVFYLPAIAYRWSIKSTAWFWFPLVLAFRPPLYGLDYQSKREIVAVRVGWQRIIFLASLAVFVWLCVPHFPVLTQIIHKWTPSVFYPVLEVVLPDPPNFGVRFVLLTIAFMFCCLTTLRARNLKFAYSKLLGSPKEAIEMEIEVKKGLSGYHAVFNRCIYVSSLS